jgi:hypothetical protein
MMRALAVLFGTCCLLLADDEPKQKVKVTHTERVEFPSGGWLRLRNSIGEVTVEGWDRPDVEITTIQSTKDAYAPRDREKASQELDKVKISVERQGADLVIATEFARHRGPSHFAPFRPAIGFDLEYHIKAPMNTKLDARHGTGEVHVAGLTSDIHVTVRNGGITLQLPQEGQYDIDAKSDLGDVTSGFPGHAKRSHWLLGHRFVQGAPAAHHLYLRVGFGDITILKIQKPSMPGPVTP